MTKNAFINGLRNALENNLDSRKIQEHVNYYNDYINEECRNGRSESNVVSELGDPWVIAKTILVSEENGSANYEDYSYSASDYDASDRYNDQPNRSKVHVFGLDSWWKKILLILGIIGVVMIIFSIITGIITLISPFIIPIVIIMFILKILKRR